MDTPFVNDKIDIKKRSLFKQKGIIVRMARNTTNLSNLLRPKRETNLNCTNNPCNIKNNKLCYQKNVVYNSKCSGCHYIGHTQRFLHIRIHEHKIGIKSFVHPHLISCSNNQFFIKFYRKKKTAQMQNCPRPS